MLTVPSASLCKQQQRRRGSDWPGGFVTQQQWMPQLVSFSIVSAHLARERARRAATLDFYYADLQTLRIYPSVRLPGLLLGVSHALHLEGERRGERKGGRERERFTPHL